MASPRKPLKRISPIFLILYERADHVNVKAGAGETLVGKDIKTIIAEFEGKMREAAANLEFEEAARLRDEIKRLEAKELGLDAPGMPASVARAHQTGKAEIDAPIQPPSGRRPRR